MNVESCAIVNGQARVDNGARDSRYTAGDLSADSNMRRYTGIFAYCLTLTASSRKILFFSRDIAQRLLQFP